MSRTFHHGERHIWVRGIRRPTDLKRLARTLIELEAARAEVEAEAEYKKQAKAKRSKRQKPETGA
ncbi:MAG: hypothetical protein WA484_13755 [Solirubrobacteraceae bacterium]